MKVLKSSTLRSVTITTPRRLHEDGVDVDTHHPVPQPGEVAPVPPGPAPCVEQPRTPRRQDVDESRLPLQVLPAAPHLPEAGGIPPRVICVLKAGPQGRRCPGPERIDRCSVREVVHPATVGPG